MNIEIRPETPADQPAVYRVEAAAFERSDEADLVDALREAEGVILSLVAEVDGEIVGHVLFSPVELRPPGRSETSVFIGAGLGPVAVLPAWQGRGIGAELCRSGIAECRVLGFPYCVVLGHTAYYPRFGFRPAATFGIDSQFEGAGDAFMALELQPGALAGRTGRIYYRPEFAGV